MSRIITFVGSSSAISEPCTRMLWSSELEGARRFEPTDQNFALTESGRLRQVVASRFRVEQYAVALEASRIIRQTVKTQAATELLRSWRKGDETEQHSTLEFLRTALDEHRVPGTKLFEQE